MRAEEALAASKREADGLRGDMDEERKKRIAKYLTEAKADKVLAMKCEEELRARNANTAWKEKAHENMENREVGPLPVPRTLQECKALYNKFPTATPYEAAYLYLVAFYRLTNIRGGKDRKITMEMLTDVFHPDCLMEKGDELKIRKHTLRAITKNNLDVVSASYFEGADPAIKHPLNEYAVNEGGMKVSFRSGTKSYTNEEAQEYKVDVHCHGCEALTDPYRTIELKYHEGRWKARGIGPLNQIVVPPFSKTGGDDDDDYFREKAYREGYGLEPAKRKEHMLKPGAGGADYVVPKADIMLEKVDVVAAAAAKKRAKYKAWLEAQPEDQKKAIVAKKVAKRAAKAKAATEAAAKGGEGDESNSDDDYNIEE